MSRSPYEIPAHLQKGIRQFCGDVGQEGLARATAELSAFFTTPRGARPLH